MRPSLAAIFLFGLLVGGCKKDKDGLGEGIIPDGELLGLERIDTLTVLSTTLRDDSVRSDGLEAVILGLMNDGEFGVTKAGFYTQVRLSTSEVDFIEEAEGSIENLELDSVVLSLAYSGGKYGFDLPQLYEVYELSEEIFSDSLYYTNRTLAVKPNDLVLPESREQRPAATETVIVDGTESVPQLRLKLDNAIGQRMFEASGTDSLTTALFSSQFIKGFFVTVDDQFIPADNGGIHYFNLLDANSKLTLYYHVAGDDVQRKYDLLINANAKYFSTTEHDYTSARPDIVNQIDDDDLAGLENVYLQAAGGLKSTVAFPYLDQLNTDTMAINRAELIVPFEPSGIFEPPNRVFAIGRDNQGVAYLLPDFVQGDAHFDGFVDVINQEYRVNLSRWVQQIMSGSRELSDIELVSERAASSANRVIVNGPAHPDRPMRLVLHYTKY